MSSLANLAEHYVDGRWQVPLKAEAVDVVHPGTAKAVGKVNLGCGSDVARAVGAARFAFETWSFVAQAERTQAIERILEAYRARWDDLANAITLEMGAPISLSQTAQVGAGEWHIEGFLAALRDFHWEERHGPADGRDLIVREPVGVCGLITPWNWPLNQIALKVIPAIAVGCTVVLKPSELAPMSAAIFADIIDAAQIPPGVFNLVQGDGPLVGAALAEHPLVDMVSFTGSTRAGVAVSQAAAPDVKRVALELGGKSPNLVFADCDVANMVARGVRHCMENSGQSCNAPTRMYVERSAYKKAVEIASAAAGDIQVGLPLNKGNHIGPVVSAIQRDRIFEHIDRAAQQGARIVAGGIGAPSGLPPGWYVRPTIFADVDPNMDISCQEVFGPVLTIAPFDTEGEAIEVANASPYGLAAYVQTDDSERAARVSRRLRAGMVQVNGTSLAQGSPFGGFKHSGNGREGGHFGLEDFLEVKAVSGLHN